MRMKTEAHHKPGFTPRKWTLAAFEPIMAEVRAHAMSQVKLAAKHGMSPTYLAVLIQKYHHGELR